MYPLAPGIVHEVQKTASQEVKPPEVQCLKAAISLWQDFFSQLE